MELKCIVIEDEVPAQNILINYVGKIPELTLSGVFSDPLLAGKKIYSRETDIIFLDLNLPQLKGLDFIKSFAGLPHIIITTAHSEFAIESFELNITDYLLKPFSFERFLKAVSRIIQLKETDKKNNTAENIFFTRNGILNRQIFIHENKNLFRVGIDEIILVEAKKDYITIYTEKKKFTILDSLSNWEKKLSNFGYFRIHRSYIIALNQIQKITGNLVYIFDMEIPIGPMYRKEFLKITSTDF